MGQLFISSNPLAISDIGVSKEELKNIFSLNAFDQNKPG
jgi:hypothetical protein